MHLHLFDHPRHRLEEHPRSCLGLKEVSVSISKLRFRTEAEAERFILTYREIQVERSQLSLCPSQ